MNFKKLIIITAAFLMIAAIPITTVQAQETGNRHESTERSEDRNHPEENGHEQMEHNDMGQRPDNLPEMNGEEPPALPDGEFPQYSQMEGGQKPDDLPEITNGQPPALPNGETPQGIQRPDNITEINNEQPPALPDGEMPQGDQMEEGQRLDNLPEMNGEQPPEKPDGDMSQMPDGERPEMSEGEMPQRPDQNMEQPDLQNNEEAKTIIEQIRTLFEKLMNLFRGNESQKADQQNNEAPEMSENRPGSEQTARQENSSSDGRNQNMNDGEMPQRPDGTASEDSRPGKPGEMNGNQGAPESFTAANTLTSGSDIQDAYTSSSDSENAVLVSGETVTMNGTTITKTGSASGDNADFYGTNAAILANNGAYLTLTGITVNTDGGHANAVFSNGSGTSVTISDSSITTSGNNSGGLMVTGGGSITADNLTVSTSGNSSAAIRSDRGGGTANVTDGSYSTAGVGSPAIYSTADITVSEAVLSASNSEAVVIEGGNSVTLNDCDVTGNNASLNSQSTMKTNVLIYQSMSGDASEGDSSFTMNGGTLTSLTGAMFHVTNTTTTIDLTNVTMNYASDSSVFLDASADSWGSSGKNGGNVTLNLTDQSITGAILCDSVSTVHVNLKSGSSWTLTGDSYITSFTGDLSAVNLNGYKLYINGVEYTE